MFAREIHFAPRETVVPVVGILDDEKGPTPHFLGTGAFIEPRPYLLTAAHVVQVWKGALAVMPPPDMSTAFRAEPILVDPKSDLALLEVRGYKPRLVFKVADDERIENYTQFVACLEYGTTRTIKDMIYFHPAFRIGNIVRFHTPPSDVSELYGLAGEDALELSFPALKGASGAPVFSMQEPYLYGVIKANVSYHLLPAQVESILDEDNKLLVNTDFMLPQAIAIHAKHVRGLIHQAGR